jgi:serpin B
MALSGARNETADQLKSLLSLSNHSNEQIFDMQSSYLKILSELNSSVALNVANKVYSKEGYVLKKEFTDNLAKYYESEAQLLNFGDAQGSAKTINDWVANKTNDKIKNLLSPDLFDELTRLVLVNAVYFKGKWLNPFDKANTYKEDFTLRDGSVQKVDMMKLLSKKFLFKINPAGLMACTCEIPYIGEKISMTIILPHEGIKIEDVEKNINHDILKEVFERNSRPGKVHLYLPRFKLDLKTEVIV